MQAQQEKEAREEQLFRDQLEQERHDHELALRLAQESNGQIEDSPPLSRRSVINNNIIHQYTIYWLKR